MRSHFFIVSTILALAAGQSSAFPVQGEYRDTPECDDYPTHILFDELGTGPSFQQEFPNEYITADHTLTTQQACPMHVPDGDPFNDFAVSATNLTGRPLPLNFIGGPDAPLERLFFITDVVEDQPGGGGAIPVGNQDGIAQDFSAGGLFGEAFVIDEVGGHKSLVFQSLAFDNLWDVGETIEFIVNDFGAPFAGLAPDLSSTGFAGASGFISPSTASLVIGVPIPEPATLAMLGVGVAVVARRRR